jgi:hypothetical protein
MVMNFPGIITIIVGSLIIKLYTIEMCFLTSLHGSVTFQQHLKDGQYYAAVKAFAYVYAFLY